MKQNHVFYIRGIDPVAIKQFRLLLKEVVGRPVHFEQMQPTHFVYLSEIDDSNVLVSFLQTFQQEHPAKIHILKTYRLHALAQHASMLAFKLNSGKVDTLGDFLLQLLIQGNHDLITDIRDEFSVIPRHLMQTASMLIACGMKATLASEKLYIHRNTFAYRLHQFIALTGLDVRLHEHALFFTLVEKLLMLRN